MNTVAEIAHRRASSGLMRAFLRVMVPVVTTGVAVVVFLPILWLVLGSFRLESDLVNAPFRLWDTTFTVSNFANLRQIPGFETSLRNSAIVALMAMGATIVAAFPLGYLLCRYNFAWRAALRAISLSGYLIAPVVLALPYFQLLTTLGLINSLIGIALTHMAFAFPIALVLSELAVRSVPVELEEIAILDGSGFWRRLTRVVLPCAKYHVAATLLLIFTISWKEFFFAFLISGGQNTRTLPVLLAALSGGEAQHWALLCAVGTVLLLPSAVMFLWRDTPLSPTGGGGLRG